MMTSRLVLVGLVGLLMTGTAAAKSPSVVEQDLDDASPLEIRSTERSTAEAVRPPTATVVTPREAAPARTTAITQPSLAAAPTTPAWDDNTAVETERPRATVNFTTVGKNRFQLETSFDYQVEQDAPASVHSFSFPTQLRYGIIDPLEVRVQGNLFTFQDTNASTATRGFGDFTFGAKWGIVHGGGLLPSVGVTADLTVPTGSDNVSNNTFVPLGRTVLAWELPADFILDTNLGVDYPRRDAASDRYARFTYGTAVRRALPLWEERLGTFAEFAGAIPFKDGKEAPHLFGTGLGVRLSDRMQLDTFARVGLNTAAPNFQTGLGFSWKLH